MKIAIVGPGALGTLFAACLAALNRHDVWMLDHDPERASQISGKIVYEFKGKEVSLNIPVSADPSRIGRAELVLLCVKSMSVRHALRHAAPLFHDNTLLVAFQNGIGHIDAITHGPIPCPTAFGVTSQGATLLAPGRVRHGGAGLTKIGFLTQPTNNQQQQLELTARILTSSGFQTTCAPNILDHIWGKLLVNVGINALTVLYDCPNGDLLTISEARETLVAAVREGQRVGSALGIHFEQDPVERALEVCRTTARNISSMLQDARNRRLTEIDAINGALIQKAQTVSIDVPVNQALVKKVKERESAYLGSP